MAKHHCRCGQSFDSMTRLSVHIAAQGTGHDYVIDQMPVGPAQNSCTVPPHAAQVWTDGQSICLAFPPTDDHSNTTVIRIPLTKCSVECSEWGTPLARQLGWRVLLDTLRARADSGRASEIGTPATPVQYDIDGMLKTMAVTVKRYNSRGEPDVPTATAEDFGL